MRFNHDFGDEKNVPELLVKYIQYEFKLASQGIWRWPPPKYQWEVLDAALAELASRLNRIAHLEKEERESKDNIARATSLRKGCVLIHEEKIKLVVAGYRS